MQKIKRSIFSFIITLLSIASTYAQIRLSEFNYGAASVLPFYTTQNTKYVILSRERWGNDAGTYDDFGGKRDPGEKHPVITAAREFHEEAILNKAIGLNLQQTQNYIDIKKSKNTHYVIANTTRKGTKNVTYITNFNHYKTQFITNFYNARKRSTSFENREKDRIALINWDDLQNAIVNQKKYNDPVCIIALVVDPKTNKLKYEKIKLRPYLVIKLGGFFRDQPYAQGKNSKIRFYTQQTQNQALCDYAHEAYARSGVAVAETLLSSTEKGSPDTSDYITALTFEQNNLKKEIASTSFFHFFKKRKLKNRYKTGKQIIIILQNYQKMQ